MSCCHSFTVLLGCLRVGGCWGARRTVKQPANLQKRTNKGTSAPINRARKPTLNECGLTAREGEVLRWLTYGKTNCDIGEILEVSPRTVQKHLQHLYAKLGVENRASAVAKAFRGSFFGLLKLRNYSDAPNLRDRSL